MLFPLLAVLFVGGVVYISTRGENDSTSSDDDRYTVVAIDSTSADEMLQQSNELLDALLDSSASDDCLDIEEELLALAESVAGREPTSSELEEFHRLNCEWEACDRDRHDAMQAELLEILGVQFFQDLNETFSRLDEALRAKFGSC